jgi:hypothetical protein
VDHQLGAAAVVDELLDDLREARLIGEEGVGDAVHGLGAGVDLPVRLDVAVEVVAGQPALDDLDAADFDNAMALGGLQARGLRVQYDLAHAAGSL